MGAVAAWEDFSTVLPVDMRIVHLEQAVLEVLVEQAASVYLHRQ